MSRSVNVNAQLAEPFSGAAFNECRAAATFADNPDADGGHRPPLQKRNKPKVGMISLGCAKNLVDAEIMLGSVLQHGMEITSVAEEADVLVVNTCAFIDSAKEESIDAILDAHHRRGLGKKPGQKLIVSGCMSQRFSRELRESLPEVDAFVGLDQVGEMGVIVQRVLSTDSLPGSSFVTDRPTYIPNYDTPRFRLTPAHSVYLKIAEGCNHPCSFCVIPQMRGRHRSRQPASVLAEIRALVAEGVKEINLISQDTTYYGMDLWAAKAGPRQPVGSGLGDRCPEPAGALQFVLGAVVVVAAGLPLAARVRGERADPGQFVRPVPQNPPVVDDVAVEVVDRFHP